jgi:hypothetical protein
MDEKLSIEVTREVDGIEMGVLKDGTSFLSMRALSRLCGIANSTFSKLAAAWLEGKRDTKLAQFLQQNGVVAPSLYNLTDMPGVAGNVIYAFPDHICTLILEYYALDVGGAAARQNYRIIARGGLRFFIYSSLGYDPRNLVPTQWRHYHDRMLLNSVPRGFFSVFTEISPIVMSAIQAGLVVDSHTVPDISVGRLWSDHWDKCGLEKLFGVRTKHPHVYPDYFPQAQANPEAWIYPVQSLGEFRSWLQDVYLPERYPKYLQSKVKQGALPASRAELLIAAVTGDDDEDEKS